MKGASFYTTPGLQKEKWMVAIDKRMVGKKRKVIKNSTNLLVHRGTVVIFDKSTTGWEVGGAIVFMLRQDVWYPCTEPNKRESTIR